MDKVNELYDVIKSYAEGRQLENTCKALPLTKELLGDLIRRSYDFDKNGELELTYYDHCLSVTKMLMDLHISVSKDEEDILLSAALCHDMIENLHFEDGGKELMTKYGLDSRIFDIVKQNTRPYQMREEQKVAYYTGIQENKLAVLVALADRGNLVEQLYGLSISEAINYVQEIRKFCLPMCVYAKEHYPDVHMPINILMEKIRNLIDVTDIISARYQKREMAYTNEILSLMEENARIRGLIKQLNGEV